MKMKNLLIGGMSLALVACISIGGTLAYLSDTTGTATNKFTMNGLTLVVSEKANAVTNGQYKQKLTGEDQWGTGVVNTAELGTDEEGGIEYQDLLPGATISKEATITVKGKHAACYVFAYVDNKNGSNLTAQVDSNYWKPVDGTVGLYYYETKGNKIVAAGEGDEKLSALFSEVKLSETLTEQTKLENITVKGYAYQAPTDGSDNHAAAVAAAKEAFGLK